MADAKVAQLQEAAQMALSVQVRLGRVQGGGGARRAGVGSNG